MAMRARSATGAHNYYPVSLDLRGRVAVVIGGGPLAETKVNGLRAAGARVTVIAPAVTDQLDQYNLGDGNGGRGQNSPWVDPKAMERVREQSPITYVSKMKTPTLIMTDMADYRVPPMQSFKLYHALVDNGVPVKFVGYPVHGHSPNDPVRQLDVQRRWIGWLAQYLNGSNQ